MSGRTSQEKERFTHEGNQTRRPYEKERGGLGDGRGNNENSITGQRDQDQDGGLWREEKQNGGR